jgi:hypothetical protein
MFDKMLLTSFSEDKEIFLNTQTIDKHTLTFNYRYIILFTIAGEIVIDQLFLAVNMSVMEWDVFLENSEQFLDSECIHTY